MGSAHSLPEIPEKNKADFAFWGKADIWSYKEAVLLSVGLEPRHFDLSEAYGEPYEPYDLPCGSVKNEVAERLFLIRRAASNSASGLDKRASPHEYFSWFQAKALCLPAQFILPPRETKPSPRGHSVSRVDQKVIGGFILILLEQAKGAKYLNGNSINVSAVVREFEVHTSSQDGASWAGARERAVHASISSAIKQLDQETLQSAIDRCKASSRIPKST